VPLRHRRKRQQSGGRLLVHDGTAAGITSS